MLACHGMVCDPTVCDPPPQRNQQYPRLVSWFDASTAVMLIQLWDCVPEGNRTDSLERSFSMCVCDVMGALLTACSPLPHSSVRRVEEEADCAASERKEGLQI